MSKSMSSTAQCPYCRVKVNIPIETDVYNKLANCPKCGKKYLYIVEHIVQVETYEAPCQNKGRHDYVALGYNKFPLCSICGKVKPGVK